MFTGAGNRAGRGRKNPKMSARTIKGNNTAASGNVLDLTADQTAAILPFGKMEYGARRAPFIYSDLMDMIVSGTNILAIPYVGTPIGTGTANTLSQSAVNHPGVCLFQSSATANTGFWFSAKDVILNGGEQYDCIFKTPPVFATVTARIGIHDSVTSADSANGVYFEFSGTGVLTAKSANASVRTTSATITTLAVSTWYHARITCNTPFTQATFQVFDNTGAQLGSTTNITTNLPTILVFPIVTMTSSGTAAISLLSIDYVSFAINANNLVRGATN